MNRLYVVGATILALLIVLAGCASPPPEIVRIALSPNPNPSVPLAALCILATDRPTVATMTIEDGINSTTVAPNEAFATEHELTVLGLRPGRDHTVTVTVRDENGLETASEPLTFSAPPLPEGFPPIERKVSRPAKMEPGVTIASFFRWPGFDLDRDYGLFVALDNAGEVVWYYETDQPADDPRRTQDGTFIYTTGREGYMYEIDMLGNVVNKWHSTGIPKESDDDSISIETDSFHHDMDILPNGNLLVLSTEVREFEDYPTNDNDPDAPRDTVQLIGDVIVEFTREGEIVQEWKLFDILDPRRFSYGSLSTSFWAQVYKDVLEKPAFDWSHTNAVVYDESDDAMIISLYHQDAVIKLDKDTGEIIWIMGDPGRWEKPWSDKLLKAPDGFRWNYHQHSPNYTSDRTIIMYDNSTNRALPFDPPLKAAENNSRAVEFKVDEANMTVEKVWSYGGPDTEIFFSPFICGTEFMPKTGNVLIADGGRVRTKDGKDGDTPISGKHWARILEVTRDDPPEKVFEVVIDDPDGGWAMYRAEKYPSLYPHVQ